jgi:hypothetical protein
MVGAKQMTNNTTESYLLSKNSKVQPSEQIQDVPFILIIILIVLSSLAGELYRADIQGITKAMLGRVAIRTFVSTVIGVIAMAYCLHKGMDIWAVGAITGSVSMIGADVVIALLTMLFKRKLGV